MLICFCHWFCKFANTCLCAEILYLCVTQVFTALLTKFTVIWDVVTYGLVIGYLPPRWRHQASLTKTLITNYQLTLFVLTVYAL